MWNSRTRPRGLPAACPLRACALLGLAALGAGAAAFAQSRAASAPASSAAHELPDGVLAALASVEDMSLRFDHAGFYALLRHVDETNEAPGTHEAPLLVDDWRALLERPGEFRGRAVTIEGTVGRSSSWRALVAQAADVGEVWQWELERTDQPLACTVVLTENASDIPLGATVRVTGYFVMIRQYYTRQNRPAPAALLVAHAPSSVRLPSPPPTGSAGFAPATAIGIGGATLVGVVIWVMLRRRSAARTDLHALRAESGAPLSLSTELADWAEHAAPAAPPEDARPHAD